MPGIFVSHASEDKAGFVRPLARAMKRRGLRIWYDEYSLTPGDSLRQSIDRGLAECVGGVVVLSEAFFKKSWPQSELNALFTADLAGRSRLIPIWHNIDQPYVASRSPLLADRVALHSSLGHELIAERLADAFPSVSEISDELIVAHVHDLTSQDVLVRRMAAFGCQHRLMTLATIHATVNRFAAHAYEPLNGEEIENRMYEIEEQVSNLRKQLTTRYKLPDGVYLEGGPELGIDRATDFAWELAAIEDWVNGDTPDDTVFELFNALDEDLDFDWLYVLFDVPNYGVSRRQRELLNDLFPAIGSRNHTNSALMNQILKKISQSN